MRTSASQEIEQVCEQASTQGELECRGCEAAELKMENTTAHEPTWRNVKAKLEGYDRAGLLRLPKILYGLNGGNHAFLNGSA